MASRLNFIDILGDDRISVFGRKSREAYHSNQNKKYRPTVKWKKKKKKGYFKMRTQDKTKYLVNKQLFIVMIYIS